MKENITEILELFDSFIEELEERNLDISIIQQIEDLKEEVETSYENDDNDDYWSVKEKVIWYNKHTNKEPAGVVLWITLMCFLT